MEDNMEFDDEEIERYARYIEEARVAIAESENIDPRSISIYCIERGFPEAEEWIFSWESEGDTSSCPYFGGILRLMSYHRWLREERKKERDRKLAWLLENK